MENPQGSRENQESNCSSSNKRNETQESSAMEDEVKMDAIAASLNVEHRSSDMAFHMQEHALRFTRNLLDSAPKPHPNLMQLAQLIKKEFDSAYGAAWHCAIGTSFGSFVSHSVGCFIYFFIDSLSILLFKTQVELELVVEIGRGPKALNVDSS